MSLDNQQIKIAPHRQNDNISVAMVMRIFSTSGGLERYAHRLVEGLLKNSYRVTVFCEQHDSALSHPHLSVVRLESIPTKLKKRYRLNYYYKEFSRLIRDLGPFDIIHTQHVAIENADVASFHNHTIHRIIKNGKFWERWLNQLKLKLVPSYKERDKFDRLLASQAKVLIFPSEICKADYEESYNLLSFREAASHLVAYPGVDPHAHELTGTILAPSSILKPRMGKGGQSAPIVFLFVGKGFRKKGLDVLLSACRILAKDGAPFKLFIAGLKEKQIDRLRVAAYGLTKQVQYLGFQRDMNLVYAKAEVIVLPSRAEPFGMAPLEAMTHGVVPIVSRVSGVSEILTNGKDALILHNHLDSQELASLMGDLIEDRQKASSLSERAISTASKYGWTNTIGSTLEAYTQLDRVPG